MSAGRLRFTMKLEPLDVHVLLESEESLFDTIDKVTLGTCYEVRVDGTPAAMLVPMDYHRRLSHTDDDWEDAGKLLMALTRCWIEMEGALMEDDRRDFLRKLDSLSRDFFAAVEDGQ